MNKYLLTNENVSNPHLQDYQNIVLVDNQRNTVAPLEIKGDLVLNNWGIFFRNMIITAMVISQLMIFFYLLISGGIQYMKSKGDKEHTKIARNKLRYAFIGFGMVVIVFISLSCILLFLLPLLR